MTVNRLFLRGIVVSFFLCLTGSLAGAVPRTWVAGSSTGNVANCPRTNPCATFAYALTQTDPGGEIDVLDSGDFGGVSIAQSVSIVAEGVVAGIQISGTAIDVAAGSSVVVVLRGLTLDGSGTGSAILLETGAVLHIEDCTINGFDTGILVEPDASSKVFIKDTIVRNNGNLGIDVHPSSATTVTASLDNVRLEGNGFGNNNLALKAEDGTNVSVRNSVVAGNAFGLQAVSSTRAAVINLESSIVSGNAHTGILSEGSSATINITNVTVVDNSTGLSLISGGHIVSFGNNKITDNTTNGSPTKTISQK
jgi:hypothetical protein